MYVLNVWFNMYVQMYDWIIHSTCMIDFMINIIMNFKCFCSTKVSYIYIYIYTHTHIYIYIKGISNRKIYIWYLIFFSVNSQSHMLLIFFPTLCPRVIRSLHPWCLLVNKSSQFTSSFHHSIAWIIIFPMLQ